MDTTSKKKDHKNRKSTPQKGDIVTLSIESTAFKGKGVAHHDGMAIFIPDTAPGDLVKARIIKRKKSFCEAKLLEIIKPSDIRQQPKCQHAFECGGCTWQHIPYDYQVDIKRQQVEDHMQRIGGFKELKVHETLPADDSFYYRNKMEYSFGTHRWLSAEEVQRDEYVSDEGNWAGLHAPGRFDKILNLKECHLQDPISYEILDFVRSYAHHHGIVAYDTFNHTGYLRNLMIRTSHHTNDLMINLVTREDDKKIMQPMTAALLAEFPQITTIINNINDEKSPTAIGRYQKIWHGPGFIVDKIRDLRFEIYPNAFFQTNTQQAEKLYTLASDLAALSKSDLVFDLYCGVGTLTLYLSNMAKKVVGIEMNPVAIESAQKNANDNAITNTDFFEGDMKEVFQHKLLERYGTPDCIITDPPRAGMHPDVVNTLNRIKVPKLIYISCNSSTMARDLKELDKNYTIDHIQPVDMFPQTYHIETVARLTSRTQ